MIFVWAYVVMVLIRPQEFVPAFQSFPIMPALLGLATIAWLAGRKAAGIPQVSLVLLFLLVTSFSRVANGWFGGALDWFIQFGPTCLLFYLVASGADSLRRIRILMGTVCACATVMAIHGIEQISNGVGWTGAELVQGRITYLGVFNDPNDLGMFFVVALPMCIYLMQKSKTLMRLVWVGCIVALCYGILLTNSRGTMLATVLIFGLLVMRRFGPFLAALLALPGFVGLAVVAPSRFSEIDSSEASAAGRVDAWYEAVQMFKSNPLFGVGANQFTDYHHLTAHNSFFLVLAESGLPGFMLFTALIGYSLLMPYRMSRLRFTDENGVIDSSTREYQQLGFTMWLAMLGFCATAFFLSRAYTLLLYILIGLVAASYLVARKNEIVLPRYSFGRDFVAWSVASAIASVALFFVVRILLRIA